MCTHLARRGSRYYFRRKIPLDLLQHYRGREVMRSLGTSDRREAERLARIVGVELDSEFGRLRAHTSLGKVELVNTQQIPHSWSLAFTDRYASPELVFRAATQAQQGPLAPALVSKGETTFAVLIDKWALGIQPQESTVKRTQMHTRRFEKMADVHTVEQVTRQHAIRFIEQLRDTGQTPQNINMHLASLIKLLNYAVRLDLIKANEASGLTIKAPSGEKARRSFDLTALKNIFSSPVYTAKHRPKGGGGDASYWLPLLALFTGARLEELCQLRPDDILQVAYPDGGGEASAWVIRITYEGEGQGLKNTGSRRRIPVHPELERLGFIDLSQQALAEGRRRIFHKLARSVDGKEGGNFTKWFGRYLRQTCKVTDKRMVFHSFRHSFKELLREAEVPKEINDALTGHESGDVGDKYGGDLYPLRPLVNAIKRYRLPGLVLPDTCMARVNAG